MDNWRPAVVAFGAAFATLAVIGGFNGIERRAANAKAGIFDHVSVVYRGGDVLLQHECDGRITHAFSVADQGVLKNLALLPTDLSSRDPLSAALPHKQLITTFLGGSAGGITLTKMLQSSAEGAVAASKGKALAAIVAVLGGVSGYTLGYWLIGDALVSCDSQVTLDILDDDAGWKEIERAYFNMALVSMLQIYPDGYWEKKSASAPMSFELPTGDPMFRCEIAVVAGFAPLIWKAESLNSTFTVEDFTNLRRLSALYRELIVLPEYNVVRSFGDDQALFRSLAAASLQTDAGAGRRHLPRSVQRPSEGVRAAAARELIPRQSQRRVER